MKMASCLIPLLAAALCVQQVDALLCYTCDTPTSRADCTTQTNCSSKFLRCKTYVYQVETGYPFNEPETVLRSCAEKCEKTDTDILVVANPVLCCDEDLCNRIGVSDESSDSSGPASISHVLLAASLGLVWVLHVPRS